MAPSLCEHQLQPRVRECGQAQGTDLCFLRVRRTRGAAKHLVPCYSDSESLKRHRMSAPRYMNTSIWSQRFRSLLLVLVHLPASESFSIGRLALSHSRIIQGRDHCVLHYVSQRAEYQTFHINTCLRGIQLSVPDSFKWDDSFERRDRLQVPRLGAGTIRWGDPRRGWGTTFNSTDIAAAFDILNDAGVNLFDTSEVYGYQGIRLGEGSEQLLGSLASKATMPPILSTKFMPVPWANLLVGGGVRMGRAAVLEGLRNSLARLGVGCVDIYSIHAPVPYVGGQQAIFSALAEAYALGLCRGVGVCNFGAKQLREAHAMCRAFGVPLLTNQMRFSLFNLERELDGTLETCLELGVVPVAQSPLAGGIASTRLVRASGQRATLWREGRRLRALAGAAPEHLSALQPMYHALSAVADAGGERRSETAVALQFVMSKGAVPIPGVATADEAKEVARTLGWELGLDELHALSDAARALHVRRADIPWLRNL
uniref:NADP-dependent oxidoreductase domain-containing protein n=1 Tax=Chrysotila carterae TaxID=13221 RepID=A0A7S4BYC6_CHRCT